MQPDTDATLEAVLACFQTHGGDPYIGEPITHLEHAAQCADLARAAGADEELIVAALLHDIGHLCPSAQPTSTMGPYGTVRHETIGANYLAECGFSARVVHLVQQHVNAKRYLTFKHPGYAARLSQASAATLALQGGPMNEHEATAFEAQADFTTILQLRAWDEAAKVVNANHASLATFRPLLARHLGGLEPRLINAQQTAFWRQHGYLKITGALGTAQLTALSAWVDDLAQRPETPGLWMKYFEPGQPSQHGNAAADARLLCRVENFLQYHDGFAQLINGRRTLAMLTQLFDEPAVLFKEKVNFKLPGGNGFAPHQDAPAFTSFGQSIHITLMISVDATHPANGCLEIAPHPGARTLLPTAADGTIDHDVAERLEWTPLPTQPGDLVFFDSYLPHRSAPNTTDRPRRALYLTYNRASEGDHRAAYYASKRAAFPPDIEREAGREYADAGVFNVGNPIR
jgi:phosphonate degradation associated HDIG domain protein